MGPWVLGHLEYAGTCGKKTHPEDESGPASSPAPFNEGRLVDVVQVVQVDHRVRRFVNLAVIFVRDLPNKSIVSFKKVL